MPTRAGLTHTPGIPSLAALACLTLTLTLLVGGATWYAFGWPYGLTFGAAGLTLGTAGTFLAADVMRDDPPECTTRNCPCACHAETPPRAV